MQEKLVVLDMWSLEEGSPKHTNFPKLCWGVAIVVERTRKVYKTTSHVDLVQAVVSLGGCHSQTCPVWC